MELTVPHPGVTVSMSTVPTEIAGSTLMAEINDGFPNRFGNHFYLSGVRGRITNFRAGTYEQAIKEFSLGKETVVATVASPLGSHSFIADTRIYPHWYAACNPKDDTDADDDAYLTLYKQFIDSLPTPELKFSNPVFHAGENTTVRLGYKWHRCRQAVINGKKTDITYSNYFRLKDIPAMCIENEHDPKCRTFSGLVDELIRVYGRGRVNPDSVVTVLAFEIPGEQQ